jgi:hypothetical protein
VKNVQANGIGKSHDECTDGWYDSMVKKYEKRPMESIANIMLAHFAKEYTLK